MADVDVEDTSAAINTGSFMWGPYWTSPSVGYVVGLYATDLTYRVYKTADSGATWTAQDDVNSPGNANIVGLACYFDQETPGNSGTEIHTCWMDSATEDVYHIPFDTSDDTWGTQTTAIENITISNNIASSMLSVTVAVSGRIYVCARGNYILDTEGTQHDMASTDDGGSNWDDRTSPYSSNEEIVKLFPGAETDENDIYAVVYDVINTDLEFWKYDASAGTWGVTAIDADNSVTGTEARSYQGFFDAATRHSDGHLLVAYWTDVDAGTGDFRCVDIEGTTPTITQKTNLDTDTDDSMCAGVLINQQNDDVYVAYVGSDAGDETWTSTVNCYFKKSADGMGTWGAEQTYGAENDDLRIVHAGRTVGDAGGRVMPVWGNVDLSDITVNDGNDVEIAASTPPAGFVHVQGTVI